MSYRESEIGLIFYTDINRQSRYKPYFNTYSGGWIFPTNKLPYFQFYGYEAATGLTNLDVINIDTGASVSVLATFNTYGDVTNVRDIDKCYSYDSDQVISLAEGRYYIYAKDDLDYEWWSEVFQVRGDVEQSALIPLSLVETGLPFYDDINKQVVRKPYYNSSIREWLTPSNRFPTFQFRISNISIANIVTFNLINYHTGASTSYLTYFNSDVSVVDTGDYTYFTHLGLTDVVVPEGKYYFYAQGVDGEEWWSEVFIICDNITKSSDYLLLDSSDYLLIGGTDKLLIG